MCKSQSLVTKVQLRNDFCMSLLGPQISVMIKRTRALFLRDVYLVLKALSEGSDSSTDHFISGNQSRNFRSSLFFYLWFVFVFFCYKTCCVCLICWSKQREKKVLTSQFLWLNVFLHTVTWCSSYTSRLNKSKENTDFHD